MGLSTPVSTTTFLAIVLVNTVSYRQADGYAADICLPVCGAGDVTEYTDSPALRHLQPTAN